MRGYARILLALGVLGLAASAEAASHVNVATISGSINPASSDYIQKAIRESEGDGAAALLLLLDTPGGLLSSTKDIIQAILNARVPVIVYVAPHGAWAASAGAFITIAGHVAAMAPGTSIGAAHPVGIGGGGGGGGGGEKKPGEDGTEGGPRNFAAEKAENFAAAFIESIAKARKRNVEWAVKAVRESVAIAQDEALELGVIDLVANNTHELLELLDGRTVDLAGEERTLYVAGAELRPIEMTALNRFLDVLASPDVAVLLIMAGLLGLYIEFNQPGLVLPGVAGLACLLMGLIALQILPFSWLGLILLFAGIGFFVAELFVASYGLLFAGGVACLLIGGSMIFEVPEMSDLDVSFWSVLLPTVLALSAFAGVVIVAVGRTLGRRSQSGTGELIGKRGRATTRLAPEGTVFVRGEYWQARADSPVDEGARVEILDVEDLWLHVRSVRPAD